MKRWVGSLSPADYVAYVQPYSQRLLKAAQDTGVPTIHFGTGTATLLPEMKKAGGTVLGLDWRIPLDQGWKVLGHDVAVQGNLDPTVLFAPLPEIKKRVEDILRRAAGRPGHIFNLGSEEIINLKDLAQLCVEANCGGTYRIIPFPADRKPIDIGDYYADYHLIHNKLGWEPRVALREGLMRTLEFYRRHKERYW